MLEAHVVELLRHLLDDGHPELRHLQHVRLVHVGHLAPAVPGGLEGHPRDARDLDLVVDHGVARLAHAVHLWIDILLKPSFEFAL